MKVLLTTFNSSFIHKNLALRWLYVSKPKNVEVDLKEYTIKDDIDFVYSDLNVEQYDVIGISVYIWNSNEVKQLITKIRKNNSKVKIILGGPEVTYENDEYFDFEIDGIVLGEGEREFYNFILDGKSDYVKVKKKQFKLIKKEDLNYLETLNSPYSLPFDLNNMNYQYLYVEASRGCPFRCSYCLSSLDNQVRFFNLDYLKKIFDEVKDYQIKQVKFLDRTFNAHKTRTLQLYKMLEEYQNIESFQVEIVVDRLDDELINLIINEKNKDRFRYEVGIQSFNLKTLESVDRRQDNLKAKTNILKLLEHNVVVHADLIAGLPYEGFESFKDSFNQLANLYPTELQLGILKLLKGTKMKRIALDLDFKYNLEAPYEVYDTPWLNKLEMDYINVVANGVSRSINRKLLFETIRYLNQSYYQGNLFEMYYEFGVIFDQLNLKYQKHDLFLAIFNKFKSLVDKNILKTVLMIDYFKYEKQKPKVLFYQEDADTFNKKIVQNNYFSNDEIYRYSRVFKDYRVDDGCIMAIFNKHQSYCDIYTIDFKENICQKISYL